MRRRIPVRLLGIAAAGVSAGCATQNNGGETAPSEGDPPSPNETDGASTGEMTDDTTDRSERGLVIETSDESVDATVDRVESGIEESPLTLVTTIDHAGNTASTDIDLPPTTLLVFGNPTVGTPLIETDRTVAIDLPQKILVWAEDGSTKIAYNDPTYLAERHGIDGQTDRLEQIRTVLDDLATGS